MYKYNLKPTPIVIENSMCQLFFCPLSVVNLTRIIRRYDNVLAEDL